jgi:hypothetical protein
MPKYRTRLGALCAAAVVSVGLAVAPAAQAQTVQEGLVNVAVDDNTIQVPVSVAANVCGVAVNVLARAANTGDVDCESAGESIAVSRRTGPGGTTRQNGLVNLAVTDNTIQIPVAVAANVCAVEVGVLAEFINTGDIACDAVANSRGNDAR